MEDKQKRFAILLIITIIALLIIGGGAYFYLNKKSLSETPERQTEWGKPITMHINDEVIFPDGLSLVLKEINDSRCKPGVQCVWQGELSALFNINYNGSFLGELHLGTVNNREDILVGYIFYLESATENSVKVSVSKTVI